MMMMTMTTITIPNEIHTLESSTIDHFHASLISLYVFVYPCIPSGTFLTPIGHHQPAVRSPSWGIRISAEVETNDQTICSLRKIQPAETPCHLKRVYARTPFIWGVGGTWGFVTKCSESSRFCHNVIPTTFWVKKKSTIAAVKFGHPFWTMEGHYTQ